MSFRKLGRFILIAGSILAIFSCKEEEETTVTPSLNGSLSFNIDQYIEPNAVKTMTPTGVTHPDGNEVGYYWKVTPIMEKADTTRLEGGLSPEGKETDGSFTYTFPDSLGTYTVSCTAFAKGYGSAYRSKYVTIVKPGLDGSVTGTGIKKEDAKVTVDFIDYYYVSHNGLDWMRNNLANPACGAPYANSEAISNVLGRYYSYEEAMTACPQGWRIPTDKEWTELAASINGKTAANEYEVIPAIAADFMANAEFNTEVMWEYWPEVGEITNSSNLAMIPAGYSNLGELVDGEYPTAAFRGINEYAIFWTADEVADEDGMAYYRYLICDQPEMYAGKGDKKSFGANVRCVRASE